MKKIVLFFIIAAHSLCFSENIKFYTYDSRHGDELKPDSVILENVSTKNRTYLQSDTLILTEVGSVPRQFTEATTDFKAKAFILDNNIELELKNSGAQELYIELYNYLGSTLYSEKIILNTDVSLKNISLENINDKLLFLKIRSNRSVQLIKLNRSISDGIYESSPILKPKVEILSGEVIDTSYKYNVYVYKKGYHDYKDLNVSFTGKKFYIANLVETSKAEYIKNASVSIKGLTIIRKNEASSALPQQPPYYKVEYDTVKFSYLRGLYSYVDNEFGRCGSCKPESVNNKILVCYSKHIVGSVETNSTNLESRANFNYETQIIDNLSFNYCNQNYDYQGKYEDEEYVSISIVNPKKFEYLNGRYYYKINKDEIIKLIQTAKLKINNETIHESRMTGGYLLSKRVSNIFQVLSVADDAYIEFEFWE